MVGRKLIKLSEIKCEEIVQKIQEGTNVISKFTNVLNKHLDYEKLSKPQIYITRSTCTVYEDDGNTPTCGYKYDVYWLFPYANVNRTIDINDFKYSESESYMWPNCLLFFKLTMTERISDHKRGISYAFKEYITEEDGIKNNNLFFSSYNENHKLNALLNVEDIYICTKKINEVYSRLLFKQTLLDELSKEVDIDDIEEYINQNTRG